MKIITTKTAGFCMGVKRAVDLALNQAPSVEKPVVTLGPLIHNNQTLELLQCRGIGLLDEEQIQTTPARVITRAHGIPPHTHDKLLQCGHTVIDGTCPKVTTVHKIIEKYRDQGFMIIIAGDEGHAEVVGLLGYAGQNVHRVHSVYQVQQLPTITKACLVAQTTFNSTLFDQIANALKEKCQELVVKKTICTATEVRQNETRELAKQVDAMIVVGGKHSANTLRLADIARTHTPLVQYIETEAELNWPEISRCETVGVTAGASTPQWMIKRVVDHLEGLSQTQRTGFIQTLKRIAIRLTNLNVFAGLAAVVIYYTSCSFQGLSFVKGGAIITFLYFLSIHLWNSLSNIEQTQHMGLSRYQFYRAHEHGLRFFSIACIVSLLVVSFFISRALFVLMFLSTLAGLIYHFSFMRKIPTSRDLFAALAWSVLITFIPHASAGYFDIKLTTAFFFMALFFMAYFRSLMFDLRDIEGDRIFGRETLVTILGEKKMRRIMHGALWFCLVALIGFAIFAVFPNQTKFTWKRSVIFLLQIPVLVYIWLVMRFYHRLKNRNEALFALLADGQFFIAGLGAWVAQVIMM